MSHINKKALARLVVFCLGTSALTAAVPAGAAVIDYPNGTDNSSAIMLTNNTTQLQVLSGSASQSGTIFESGGSFGLEKIGAGTLTLLGSNNYTGTTTITAGALQLGNGTSAITIAGPVVDNGQLIYTASGGSATLSGNITGSGSLVVSGVGQSLTLTGSNSYGATVISCNCQLNVGNGGTTGSLGTGNVTNNGTLAYNRSDAVTINTAMSGTGSLSLLGSGTFTIAVPQSFTGGTNVQAGSTVILSGTGSLASTGTVGVGGTFDVSQAAPAGLTVTAISASTPSAGSLVLLGNKTLTISNNSGSEALYGGNITGTGGITVAAGQQRFTGIVNYTGGTTIAAGATLRLSNGGSIAASSGVVDNGTLDLGSGTGIKSLTGSGLVTGGVTITNASGTFSGSIGNSNAPASLTIAGGTQTLSGTNVLSNVTVNAGATLALSGSGSLAAANNTFVDNGSFDVSAASSGPSIQFLSGTGSVILGSNTFTLANPGGSGFTSTFSGVISGAGGITIAGGSGGSGANRILAGNNTYTGTTTIQSGGTLQIGNGGTTGAIAGDVANSGTLIFNRTDTTTYAGAISGTGIVKQSGTGTLILTGASTYTGTTTINAGTLQIGNGGAAGSLTSDIAVAGPVSSGSPVTGAVLIFNRSDNLTFSNSISSVLPGSGPAAGSLIKQGAGTLTLSGNSGFSGATTVSAGSLNVTGAIASSAVSVQSGATLAGTGKVGATNIANGGSLMPGSGTAPGTLTVTGNLTLASGASYLDTVTPTAASLTSVSGTASINGSAIANVAAGTYTPGQRFTLLTATGGVSGSFASLTGIPANLKGQLSYDANSVYLSLSPNALAPSLSDATANQSSGVGAIDAAVAAGGTPGGGFVALYSLPGPALNNAVNQISTQIGPNTITAVGQGFQSFLSLTSEGGAGDSSFAPGSAYGAAGAPHRAQLGAGETRVWGAVYGGHVGLSADAASGAASLSASNVGFVAGVDLQVTDDLMAGATLGFGRQNFSSGNGTGDSDDVMIGVHARKEAGPVYVSAAFGYGWHQITTRRVVTISGTDVLQGKQDADDFGGRLEAGWRTMLDNQYRLSPYAAVSAESFETPAYGETATSGASTFALSFAAHSSTLGRSELGADVGRNYETDDGVLAADLRIAWAHQLDDAPFTLASFQSLPGSSFLVAGVRPARDDALLGASLEMRERSGLFLGLKGETLLGSGTTTVEGMGELGWRW